MLTRAAGRVNGHFGPQLRLPLFGARPIPQDDDGRRAGPLLRNPGIFISSAKWSACYRGPRRFPLRGSRMAASGLLSAAWITVDDTAHATKPPTASAPICNAHFGLVRTTGSKSRLNLLARMRAG